MVFSLLQKGTVFEHADPELVFWPYAFSVEESDRLFRQLMATIPWQSEQITVYGRRVPVPRLTAWFGDRVYQYSGICHTPLAWTPILLHIKDEIEQLAGASFNSVLLNLYRNGQDSVAWHSDDEPELGQNPIIASVSFGAERRFCLRHKQNFDRRLTYRLNPGSVLLMRGDTQHHWQHCVPKTTRQITPRINLTFRTIVVPNQ